MCGENAGIISDYIGFIEMRKLTPEQKEQLKKARREAYLKMKEKRDKDPEYIALKEAQKKKRKEAYQKIKESRNADKEAKKAEERRKREQALLNMLGRASDINPKKRTDK